MKAVKEFLFYMMILLTCMAMGWAVCVVGLSVLGVL